MKLWMCLFDKKIFFLISLLFLHQPCASALSENIASILPNRLNRGRWPKEGFVTPYSIFQKLQGPVSTCNMALRLRANVPRSKASPRCRSAGGINHSKMSSGYIGPIGPLTPFRSEFFSSSTIDRSGSSFSHPWFP
jgi:hypothetical protein